MRRTKVCHCRSERITYPSFLICIKELTGAEKRTSCMSLDEQLFKSSNGSLHKHIWQAVDDGKQIVCRNKFDKYVAKQSTIDNCSLAFHLRIEERSQSHSFRSNRLIGNIFWREWYVQKESSIERNKYRCSYWEHVLKTGSSLARSNQLQHPIAILYGNDILAFTSVPDAPYYEKHAIHQ